MLDIDALPIDEAGDVVIEEGRDEDEEEEVSLE
jgi:hypothetical protein